MVMATQNPLESYGTFPLPEAQTDRFFMRLQLGYMTREQEMAVIARESAPDIIARLEQVVTPEETAWIKENWPSVQVSPEVRGYMMDIVEKTRRDSRFVTGVSTRGAIALYRAAQVTAALEGRDYVLPEDVRKVSVPVLAHRISTGSAARSGDAREYLKKLVEAVPVPLETLN
jgi:MoxR-like ATPase